LHVYNDIYFDIDGRDLVIYGRTSTSGAIQDIQNRLQSINGLRKIDNFLVTSKAYQFRHSTRTRSYHYEILQSQVKFQPRSAKLNSAYERVLDNLADILHDSPYSILTVYGHTGIDGTVDETFRLSEQRAIKVKEYLVNKGIQDFRIKVVAMGAMDPITVNILDTDRVQNGRVDFKIE